MSSFFLHEKGFLVKRSGFIVFWGKKGTLEVRGSLCV